MPPRIGTPASAFKQQAQHILFVEGKDDRVFDPTVLRELFRAHDLDQVRVHALGPCDDIYHAAKAMALHHPSYYFVIDRDGRDEKFIEQSWRDFPNPDRCNLLVWRKRELENYFIDPKYLSASSYLRKDVDPSEKILGECKKRLYMETANRVLLHLRQELLRPPHLPFWTPDDRIHDRAAALQKLKSCPGIVKHRTKLQRLLEDAELERLFDQFWNEMTGGRSSLANGKGQWLELISGKQIFHAVAGSLFRVEDRRQEVVQGKEAHEEIVKDLLRRPLREQPEDFQELFRLIEERVKDGSG